MDYDVLQSFVAESNRIEGITRAVYEPEMSAHRTLLGREMLTADALRDFVSVVQPNAVLRDREGLNVRVGPHVPPPGGRRIAEHLGSIMEQANAHRDAYAVHHLYETLHPFTDGNGRSGRALWLWMMQREGYDGRLGFLHLWYYQSLQAGRPTLDGPDGRGTR